VVGRRRGGAAERGEANLPSQVEAQRLSASEPHVLADRVHGVRGIDPVQGSDVVCVGDHPIDGIARPLKNVVREVDCALRFGVGDAHGLEQLIGPMRRV